MRTLRLFCPIQEKRLSARHRSSSRVAVYWREGGAGQEEAAFLVEDLGVDGRHGAAGRAEEHHVAARAQHVEAAVEGVLAHRVVDDVDALAARDALRLLDEVLLGVEDDLVGARFPGELRLLLGARGPDDGRAAQLGELDEQEPDPAGRGVHERRLAFLKGEGAVRQVVGGHALEHDRGGHPRLDQRDVEGHQVLGRGDHVLRVGAGRAREGHVISG